MTEQPPLSETLETYKLSGRSLQDWHDWLTVDEETSTPTGHLIAPCSRYGRNSDECAWYAIAAEVVVAESNGGSDDPEASLDHLMGLAVNDADDVVGIIYKHWYAIPECLQEMLGTKEDVWNLIT